MDMWLNMKFNVKIEMETDRIENIEKLFMKMKKIANDMYIGKCRLKIDGEPNIIFNAVKAKISEKKIEEKFFDFFNSTWIKNY